MKKENVLLNTGDQDFERLSYPFRPQLSVGDWFYFENMGAYTLALSTNFNGFPMERYTYYYVTPKTW